MVETKSIRPVETAPVVHRLIPDPLEGVIEGSNRHERYCNFVTGVLAKIWPPNSGDYSNDFWRPSLYDERFLSDSNPDRWVSGYSQFSPQGRDPLNLTPEEFETVVEKLKTPDYVRIRSIPPQLLRPEISVVLVGGSCALETNSMHTIADIRAHIKYLIEKLTSLDGVDPKEIEIQIAQCKKMLADFVLSSLAMAPTISHISGALLGGCDVQVHYWETDMWRERLEKDLGIPPDEAERAVILAYKRIHEAVNRRSLLINPGSITFIVNFDELKLYPAIQSWAASMGLDLKDHRVIEVIYTYVGPEQLNLLKKALEERQKQDTLTEKELQAVKTIMTSNLHVRGKQIDHLRWGSMNLPKEVIMGLRPMTEEEKEKYETDYPYRMGIKIMTDVYRLHTHDDPTSVVVGFADLPSYNNKIQHESRNVGFQFHGSSPDDSRFLDSVNQQIHNPARLNQLNVAEHLAFLREYLIDRDPERDSLLTEMRALQEIVRPIEDEYSSAKKTLKGIEEAISRYERNIYSLMKIICFATQLLNGGNYEITPEMIETAQELITQKAKALKNAQQKQSETPEALTDADRNDIKDLPQLIAALEEIRRGNRPILSEIVINQLWKIFQGAAKLKSDLESQLSSKHDERQIAQAVVDEKASALRAFEEKRERIAQIQKKLSTINLRKYFPLSDNPFIHHAMQFLWDPDFIVFLREAVSIQERRERKILDRDTANQEMRKIMEIIYRKLEAYILYIYGIIDYPYEMRNTRVFLE